MTGGSLPAQTWHDIMVVAHQGVEIKEIPGVGAGQKQPRRPSRPPRPPMPPRMLETKPGPPPMLTRRGADILVRVEKLLDDAGKTAAKTSPSEPPKRRQAGHLGALASRRQLRPPANRLRRSRATADRSATRHQDMPEQADALIRFNRRTGFERASAFSEHCLR